MNTERFKGELNNKVKYRTKPEDTIPCYEEYSLSLKCLDDNFYERDKCSVYFENYRRCKAFWQFVCRERKKKGTYPFLPTPDERPSVKEQYLPYFKG